MLDEDGTGFHEDSPGRRLEIAIRSAMARQGTAQTMRGLAAQARVSPGTLYDWFNNDVTPSSPMLGRVAKVIEVPIRDLWDAWEGRDQTSTSTQEAIDRLIVRLDSYSDQQAEVVKLLRDLSRGAIVAGVARALGEAAQESPRMPPARRPRRKRQADESAE